jgi:2-oxoglutarate dehydrogenase E1 component
MLKDVPGQVYYRLLQDREERKINDVALSRLEQISPFPYDLVRGVVGLASPESDVLSLQVTPHLDKYPNASLMWCQVRPVSLLVRIM